MEFYETDEFRPRDHCRQVAAIMLYTVEWFLCTCMDVIVLCDLQQPKLPVKNFTRRILIDHCRSKRTQFNERTEKASYTKTQAEKMELTNIGTLRARHC